MNEQEKLERARMYIEKLANGVNPLNDEEVPDDSLLNHVRLTRCFFYVADVLRQQIENGGPPKAPAAKRQRRAEFALTPEQHEAFPFSAEPLVISALTALLNELVDPESMMKKVTTTSITGWLVNKGFLTDVIVHGKRSRRPTRQGEELGMYSETRQGMYGEYVLVLYKETAQRFIVDNIETIVKEAKGKDDAKETEQAEL